jgi:hypothetical protein
MLKPMARMMNAGLKVLDLEQIERTVKPTEAQRATFNDLKAVSSKAEEAIRKSCPGKPPSTLPGRLEAAERRLAATLAGMRVVRPAVDAFYAMLNEEQKSRFDAIRPDHGGQDGPHQQRDRD